MATTQGPLCHEHGIRGYGDPDAGVVIVGIAPGRDEATRSKQPFTGASGQLLNDLLKFAGWSRDRVYATNTICWFNNTPSAGDIEACMPRFNRELEWAKPRLIVTAGAIANETVMGHKRFKGSRGSVIWSPRWKSYILDTHHPSAVLQAQSMSFAQDIIRDLSKIKRVLEWPRDGSASGAIHYNTINTIEEGQRVMDTLPTDRPVTLDIETSNPDAEAIDAYSDALLTFSLSFHDLTGVERTYVFPTRLWPDCVRQGTHARAWRDRGGCPDCALPQRPLDWNMAVEWTFQFGQFDIPALCIYFDQLLPLRGDTGLLSYCADERPGNHGLKPNGREWLGLGWWESEVKPFYKGKMDKLPPEKVELYNATDSIATLRLEKVHRDRATEDGTMGLYHDLLLPAMQTFIGMQVRGINVDQSKLQQLAYDKEGWFRRYLEMYKALQEEAHDIGWPTDDLNFNSSPQLQKFFFQVLGLDPIKFSKKTGKPSLDKETLDQMDHPFAAKLREFRTLDGMIDYVMAIFNNLKYDGKLHPSAFVTTTRTGRTSYRDPAMQTLPKDYTVGADYARLREIIIPHNPLTHGILEADYGQIEVWMCWYHTQDPALLEHLTSGDVHSYTAEGSFNISRHDFEKAEWSVYRQNAKKIRFGLMYGEGASGLARPRPVGIGGTVSAAQKAVNNFWQTYPTHRKWTLDTQRRVLEEGYLRSASGRVMRFPIVLDHKALRQAINFPIQADSTDTNLYSMVELAHPDHAKYEFAKRLAQLNSWIILNIHDSLVVEYDRRYEDEVIALVKEVMERPKFPGYPAIKVDVKIGDNLGSVKEIKH